MESQIRLKNNKLVYPIYAFIGILMDLIFNLIGKIPINRFAGRINSIKNNVFVRNTIGLTVFNAIGGVVVLFTNVKLANTLGAAVFGLYSYYIAIGEVGQNFVRYGRNKTMIRDLVQLPYKSHSLISNTLGLSIINILFFLTIIILFSGTLEVDVTLASILLIISPCLMSIDLTPVYEALKLMSWHSIYNLIQKFIFLIGIWGILLFWDNINLLHIGIALFISWIYILVIQCNEVIKSLNISILKCISLRQIWDLYKENFIIALSCMIGVAFGPLIRIILNQYVNEAAVGIYSAGFQIFLMSNFIISQIGRVGNPLMAELGKPNVTVEKKKIFLKRYLLIMLIGALPFVVPLSFFSSAITTIFFTEEYIELALYLPYFAIYLLALAIGIVYTQFLLSIRKDKAYFIIYTLGAIFTVISGLILIPLYGVLGGVLSLCIPHSVACVAYGIVSQNYLKK